MGTSIPEGESWETPSLEWLHRIREDMWRERHGRSLEEINEEDFAPGLELAQRLGLSVRGRPLRGRSPRA